MKDKIVIEKTFFVQVVISLIMSYSYFQEFLQTILRLPIMVLVVVFANMYFNAISIGYKLKSKTLKLTWCFKSSFEPYSKL